MFQAHHTAARASVPPYCFCFWAKQMTPAFSYHLPAPALPRAVHQAASRTDGVRLQALNLR